MKYAFHHAVALPLAAPPHWYIQVIYITLQAEWEYIRYMYSHSAWSVTIYAPPHLPPCRHVTPRVFEYMYRHTSG